jgi:hypothetical protein
MVRRGRNWQPRKVTGAGPGYAYGDGPVIDELNQDFESADRNIIRQQLSRGSKIYRMKKKKGFIAADFSVQILDVPSNTFLVALESLRGVNRNSDYKTGLRNILNAALIAEGKILSLRHEPLSLHGEKPSSKLLKIEYPVVLKTQDQIELLFGSLTESDDTVLSNVRRAANLQRLVIELSLPREISKELFLEGLIEHDGNFRR